LTVRLINQTGIFKNRP